MDFLLKKDFFYRMAFSSLSNISFVKEEKKKNMLVLEFRCTDDNMFSVALQFAFRILELPGKGLSHQWGPNQNYIIGF